MHIGQFQQPGEYYKDFFLLKEGSTYHLFYNVGRAGATQDWWDEGNEKCFGHATSADLNDWTIHPRILPAVPGTWEDQVVSAPSILKVDGVYKMMYTGFDAKQCERVGLAESIDLFEWRRHPNNPLYIGPDWTNWQPDQWADCRDAHIIRHGDDFLMYNCVVHKNGRGAIALARSRDLLNWEDLGPIVQTEPVPESPILFERGGRWFMITSAGGAGAFAAPDPVGPWESIPMELPADHFAWEVLREKIDGRDRYVIAAFYWQLNGNYIRFWELGWENDLPKILI